MPEDLRPTSSVERVTDDRLWADCEGSPTEALAREEALAQVASENRLTVEARGGEFDFVAWSIVLEITEPKSPPGFTVDVTDGVLTTETHTSIQFVRPTAAERRRYEVALQRLTGRCLDVEVSSADRRQRGKKR